VLSAKGKIAGQAAERQIEPTGEKQKHPDHYNDAAESDEQLSQLCHTFILAIHGADDSSGGENQPLALSL
jgi:hypothetical protein